LGPGPGPNRTVAKCEVWVVNQSEPSIRVWLDGKLPILLNWAGCQRVAQRVHVLIHVQILFLKFVNNIVSKSRFHQPIMCFCMVAVCNIDQFGIHVLPFIYCNFAYHAGQ
jgi:hypothetical protein